MNKLVKQNLKRIATELQDRFDYSEVDDLLLDIEEIEQALTPPTADEIVKDIIKWFNSGMPIEYKGLYTCSYKDNKFIVKRGKGITFVLASYNEYGVSIMRKVSKELAHKITSFFMNMEEK